MNRKGFTLLELLIVIAILAVLATVAVLVINPLEYLKQSRDAKRLGDMETLNKALNLADFEGISLGGASTTVFVSLVDTVATCANLGLPQLPTGYQYHCVTAAASLNKVDGTGWIPVNLTALAVKSPLGSLPVDPINSNTQYYTYIPSGSFALSATLESDKYLKQAALTDGGTNPGKIEMGSDLRLLTNGDGLVGYWPFDEGSGVSTIDASSNGNTGAVTASTTWTQGKKGMALEFNGVSSGSAVDVGNASTMNPSLFTIAAWINPTDISGQYNYIFSNARDCCGVYNGIELFLSANKVRANIWNSSAAGIISSQSIANNAGWKFIVATYDGTAVKIYIDGVLDVLGATAMGVGQPATYRSYIGRMAYGATYAMNGTIDDVRVYDRALSATEVKAIYSATK